MRIFWLFLIWGITLFSSTSTPPQLTDPVVKRKISEILEYHVRYKAITPELVNRTLSNFIEELDPTKTYFIEPDIDQWLRPSSETTGQFLEGFKKGDYSGFNAIFDKMLFAIKRHRSLTKEISHMPLPQNPKPEDLNEIPWAVNQKELVDRLLKIKALQTEAAKKLDEEPKELFFKRIEKYRTHYENELLNNTLEEQKKLILSYVLKSFCLALDAHTNYLTPRETSQFIIQVQEKLVGIGALLKDSLDGFEIVRILDKSPAEKSQKLKIKDKIIAVDQKPVIGMALPDAVELIRGQANTKVILTILRQKENSNQTEKIDVPIVREEIILDDLRVDSSFQPYADGVIAYLHLNSFYQDAQHSSASDLKDALEKIQKEHKINGVILDLRGNGGGLLPQAVAVTGLFIGKGVVASIKDNTGRVQHLRNPESSPIYDGPLVVLTSKASASAAEIVAQTLQDYGRAIIVGDERTFGKGSFQTFTLDPSGGNRINPEGEYKVTRGLYYTVSGKSPQLKGVPADIVVPGILSEQNIGENTVKYPLENDSIKPSFDDQLEDIMPALRPKIEKLYKNNMQPVLTVYTDLIEPLKENSKQRVENNKTYQSFLKELKNKNFDAPVIEIFVGSDMQLTEAYNVLKDLIYLLEIQKESPLSFQTKASLKIAKSA